METPQQQPGAQEPRCAQCGSTLPPFARRCPNCGASLSPTPRATGAVAWTQVLAAVLIGLFVLPLGACGAFLSYGTVASRIHSHGSNEFPIWLGVGGIIMIALAVGGV